MPKLSQYHRLHLTYLDEILVPIARELGYSENTEQALALIESLFSTICRILPFSQAIQLFTALPLPFQALTLGRWEVDRWLPNPITSLSDLLDEVVASHPQLYPKGETGKVLAQHTLLAIMKVVSVHTSPPELEQIISVLPSDARERIYASIALYHHNQINTPTSKVSTL
ncbi:DUF2267 domain-containing protein [Tunicatimonas pelagia]|uniref:DUF2267 domain-containing protein n=1 Tax=Tunicatimonas pelagia TaxID=931531 RepID=UPI002665EDF7|nr:DUF2267 domain-containing protein [Tunicatimonas pelagia]WKN43668.1 DUF2267 domain-containing protein [Tunicatimonas pelagia]